MSGRFVKRTFVQDHFAKKSLQFFLLPVDTSGIATAVLALDKGTAVSTDLVAAIRVCCI
jgi:hypothetical protein